MINVRDFGATGDGVTDDRIAIQAALNATIGTDERDVFVPDGRYICSASGGGAWCLTVPAGVRLRGATRAGAVLLQAPSMPGSVRLLEVAAADVTIENLTLDGNVANQTPDEHRAGVFADHALGLLLRNVTSQNFSGDGFYIYVGTHAATIVNCLATGNHRNGITFGGGTTGGTVVGSQFVGNLAQQFDSEPVGTTVDGLVISGCTMDVAGVSSQYALTIAGSSTSLHSHGWTVTDCTITGGVEAVWFDDLVFARNTVTSPTTSPAITVYRSDNRISIEGNTLAVTGAAQEVVAVFGTGVNQVPADVRIAHNTITASGAIAAHGVHVISARSVEIVGNTLAGPGIARTFFAGVLAKTTVVGEDIQSLQIRGNTISGFGQYGVSLTASGGAVLRTAEIEDNVFSDAVGGPMTKALFLTVGRDVSQINNAISGGCTTPVAATPLGGVLTPFDGQRWLAP